jgi:hypothetical protein
LIDIRELHDGDFIYRGEDRFFFQTYPIPYAIASDRFLERMKNGEISAKISPQYARGLTFPTQRLKRGLQQLGLGVVLAVAGIVITNISRDVAVNTGQEQYTIFFGLVAVGGLMILRGLWNLLIVGVASALWLIKK